MNCLTLTQLAHRYGITWLMCHIYLPPHMAAFGTYMCIYVCVFVCIYGCVFVFCVCVCVREREPCLLSLRSAPEIHIFFYFIFFILTQLAHRYGASALALSRLAARLGYTLVYAHSRQPLLYFVASGLLHRDPTPLGEGYDPEKGGGIHGLSSANLEVYVRMGIMHPHVYVYTSIHPSIHT